MEKFTNLVSTSGIKAESDLVKYITYLSDSLKDITTKMRI